MLYYNPKPCSDYEGAYIIGYISSMSSGAPGRVPQGTSRVCLRLRVAGLKR